MRDLPTPPPASTPPTRPALPALPASPTRAAPPTGQALPTRPALPALPALPTRPELPTGPTAPTATRPAPPGVTARLGTADEPPGCRTGRRADRGPSAWRRTRCAATLLALLAAFASTPLLTSCGLADARSSTDQQARASTEASRSAAGTGTRATTPSPGAAAGASADPSASGALPAPRSTLDVPPRAPAELLRDDGDGAVAAASWFVTLVDQAFRTGDSGPLRLASGQSCAWCAGTADDVDSLALAVGGYQVPTFSARSARAVPLDDGTWVVDVTTTTATLTVTESRGIAVMSQGPSTPLVLGLVVRHGTGGWKVEGVDPR